MKHQAESPPWGTACCWWCALIPWSLCFPSESGIALPWIHLANLLQIPLCFLADSLELWRRYARARTCATESTTQCFVLCVTQLPLWSHLQLVVFDHLRKNTECFKQTFPTRKQLEQQSDYFGIESERENMINPQCHIIGFGTQELKAIHPYCKLVKLLLLTRMAIVNQCHGSWVAVVARKTERSQWLRVFCLRRIYVYGRLFLEATSLIAWESFPVTWTWKRLYAPTVAYMRQIIS